MKSCELVDDPAQPLKEEQEGNNHQLNWMNVFIH
jgi:hypothetical protein|tara:strand:- start:120 stop:221 length:102 start_codon:yes stop_codon:yes gene_type:complete